MSNSHFQTHKHTASTRSAVGHQEMKMDGAEALSASFVGASPVFSAFTAPSNAAATLQPDATPWSQFANLQRQQLAWLAECASSLFSGLESVRKTQQEAAHLASDHHATAAQRLRAAQPQDNWLELMSAPLCVDVPGCEKYWAQMVAASVQAQTEIIQSIYQIFEKSPDAPAT